MRTSASSPALAGRTTGTMTPVEVSLCAQAIASTAGSPIGCGASPGSACRTIGSPRNGALRVTSANLRLNSPKRQVQRAVAHERQRRGVPEGGRAAVAERDLVALGRPEQLGDAGAHAPDERLDGLLAVRGAHERGVLAGEAGERRRDGPSRGRSRTGRRPA